MLAERIRRPGDLKRLPVGSLPRLAEELRQTMIETTSKNGGHLASSLGVVELTIALHRVFDLPKDHIVWDVGHQSYAHKMLTGRYDRFSTLRQEGGLSGFPKSAESPYDAFVAGHSSTSISAALGIASAKKLQGDQSRTIAVIGDGALTGGMAYEGLNNAGRFEGNLIVILNDNERSISKNTGAMAKYLATVRNKPGYYRFKDFVEKSVRKTPLVGEKMRNLLSKSKTVVKESLYPSTMFEELGFFYLGPVDGHDIVELEAVLNRASQINHPVFVHVQTKKGKGYAPAEENPGAFHGVSAFDAKTGSLGKEKENFSSVFGNELKKLADQDPKVVAITAAMESGTGLSAFAKAHPDRFFDVGIAEEHAVTFAGGLAAGGMLPVFAVYSTFLQRGYDQIIHDLAIEKRHVVLAVDRAGLVGEDGETHQGIFDVSYLSHIPGVTIYSPACFEEVGYFLKKALYETDGVVVLRYPRGGEMASHASDLICKERQVHLKNEEKTDLLLVSYGRISEELFPAVARLKEEGISADLLKLLQIAPLPEETLAIAEQYQQIIFFEESCALGGVAEKLLSALHKRGWRGRMIHRAVEGFPKQSSVKRALETRSLTAEGMACTVKEGLHL